MPSSPWSAERRARHSAAIRQWAPWTKSTGPRTVAGKAKSSMNALKHGQYCRQAYEFRAALRRKMAYFQFLCHRQDELRLFQRNELLKGQTQTTCRQQTFFRRFMAFSKKHCRINHNSTIFQSEEITL